MYLYTHLISSIYISNIQIYETLLSPNQLLILATKEHLQKHKNVFNQPYSYEIRTIFKFKESICHYAIVEFIRATT